MRMRRIVVVAIVLCGCFSEDGEAASTNDTRDASEATAVDTSVTDTSATTADPSMTTSAETTTADEDGSGSTTVDPVDPETSSTGGPAEDVVQDFVADLCTAVWTNDSGTKRGCPVYPDEKAILLGGASPASEEHPVTVESTGVVYVDGAILLVPRRAVAGGVYGQFEGLVYEAGDRFRATAVCVAALGCSVELVLAHSIEDAAPTELVREKVSDDIGVVELDIPLEGDGFVPGVVTELSLIVEATGGDALLLDHPRIVRP